MYVSTLSNPLDFFEFAFFTMLIISSGYVGIQKKLDAFFLKIVLGPDNGESINAATLIPGRTVY